MGRPSRGRPVQQPIRPRGWMTSSRREETCDESESCAHAASPLRSVSPNCSPREAYKLMVHVFVVQFFGRSLTGFFCASNSKTPQ